MVVVSAQVVRYILSCCKYIFHLLGPANKLSWLIVEFAGGESSRPFHIILRFL